MCIRDSWAPCALKVVARALVGKAPLFEAVCTPCFHGCRVPDERGRPIRVTPLRFHSVELEPASGSPASGWPGLRGVERI
eukprot:6421376-Alexandrium_andersonii.AAC.1